MGCCRAGTSNDVLEEPPGGGIARVPPAKARGNLFQHTHGLRTFESGSSYLQKGRRLASPRLKGEAELDSIKNSSEVTRTLRGLLKDSMGQRYFLKFCHAEFSSENPEYWLAVQASARSTGAPMQL